MTEESKLMTAEDCNREISVIMREALRKKQMNGLCYGCGAPKKILLQNACMLPLAIPGEGAYEITIAVVCSHCGAVVQHLASVLFTEDEIKKLDEISARMKEITEKKEG